MSILEQLAAKAQVTGDVGEGLNGDIEAAQADVHRLQGGAIWLKEGVAKLASLADHIRKDFEDGKLASLEDKAVHDLLLDYNRKAQECLLNFAELKKSEGIATSGRLAGLKAALDLVQKHHQAAAVRATQIMQAVSAENPPENEAEAREARQARAPGEHPGPSALDGRRIEALKAEVAADAAAGAAVLPMKPPASKKSRKARKAAQRG
jgi:hypothetical protein